MKRIESLDSLRGIAAFVVVIFHIMISFVLLYNANYLNKFDEKWTEAITLSPLKLFWAGNEGVLLFFVLSGFVLSLPFWNGRHLPYKAYLVKRFCRIYIPYIIIMFATTILVSFFYKYNNIEGLSSTFENRWGNLPSVKDIIMYILMIDINTANVNGVVWSLYHEMRISIILPLFLLIMLKFNFIKSFFINIGICLVSYAILIIGESFITSDLLLTISHGLRMTIYYCVFFLFGAYLAKYVNTFVFVKNSTFVKLSLFTTSILIIEPRWVLHRVGLDYWMISNVISVIGILLLLTAVIHSNLADRILTVKPLLWLGKISYSLYLVHIPIIMLSVILLSNTIGLIWSFIVAILISLVVADLTYRTIEVKSIKLGSKYSKLFLNKRVKGKSLNQLETKQ